MRQECDRKVEEDIFDRDGLQGRLDSTVSQLLWACNSFTASCDRQEPNCGRSAGIFFVAPVVSCGLGFKFHRWDGLLGEGRSGGSLTRLRDVIASASDSLELHFRFIGEQLGRAEWGCRVTTASPERAGLPPSIPFVPSNG